MKRNPRTMTTVRRHKRSRSGRGIESAAVAGVIVIPARYASTRFPGKPLALIAGVSLIQRVYERAAQSKRAGAVFVATDDARIADHVRSFGGRAVMPPGDFQSGPDPIAASLSFFDEPYEYVVNVQGDEPMIDITSVDKVFVTLEMPGVDMATLSCPRSEE